MGFDEPIVCRKRACMCEPLLIHRSDLSRDKHNKIYIAQGTALFSKDNKTSSIDVVTFNRTVAFVALSILRRNIEK